MILDFWSFCLFSKCWNYTPRLSCPVQGVLEIEPGSFLYADTAHYQLYPYLQRKIIWKLIIWNYTLLHHITAKWSSIYHMHRQCWVQSSRLQRKILKPTFMYSNLSDFVGMWLVVLTMPLFLLVINTLKFDFFNGIIHF